MPPITNGVISRKITSLEGKLAEIRGWRVDSLDCVAGSSLVRNAVERGLQVCVEVVIDIAERIVALADREPADSSYGNLVIAEQLGALKDASKYRGMIQFRNFIVHRYEKIEPEFLYDIVANRLGEFEEFIQEIKQYAERP